MTRVGMTGHAPGVLIRPIVQAEDSAQAIDTPSSTPVNPEQAKYAKLWAGPDYRRNSPGESKAVQFLEVAKPLADSEVTCFGCGSGREAMMLGVFGLRVTMLDFTENCLDPEVAQACETQNGRMTFRRQDLTQFIPSTTAYGFCCDVMEHIPTEDVQKVLRNILAAAERVYFGISTVDDFFGATIGEPLHLTVKPVEWWVEQLREAGAVIHYTTSDSVSCDIYCSNWSNAAEICKNGKVNVSDDELNKNISDNIDAGWMQCVPHDRQDREIVLLAGGPSMAGEIDRIRLLRENGCALVTVNGAYKWAIDQGLKVSAQIVLDAREFNARFVDPVTDDCRYLIASQCNPAVLKGLPYDRTYLWHAFMQGINEQKILEKYGSFFPTPGGSTVVLRAIPLLRMLGFYRIHVFGFDSCVMQDGTHHAYVQKENDGAPTVPVTCGGRTFECAPWMLSQAAEFQDVVRFLGDEVELAIYGDGLIRHMLQTGAEISHLQKET